MILIHINQNMVDIHKNCICDYYITDIIEILWFLDRIFIDLNATKKRIIKINVT